MIKSQTLTIALPTNEKVENTENMSQASADDAVTIILDAKKKTDPKTGNLVVDSVNGNVVNEVYYYFGKPGGDAGMLGPGGVVLSANNNLKKSEFMTDEVNSTGDHSARGIRKIIQDRNKDVLREIKAIKKQLEEGKFGSLETKDGREAAMAKYNEAASKITPQASYRGLVDVLDEMQINSISKYQIDNMTDVDVVMLDDYRKHNGQ